MCIEYVLSLQEEKYARQIDELEDDVKRLIQAETDVPLAKLELLDSVHRLGFKYKFQEDVKQALDVIYNNSTDAWLNDDLYSIALRFRILRRHGYTVAQGLSSKLDLLFKITQYKFILNYQLI